MSTWVFAATVGVERVHALLSPISFEAISDRVAREMEVLCCHRRQCDDDTQFSGVVFCVRVPPSLFDLLFNSPNGYRGAYYRSPYVGLEANDALIRRLSPVLLDWAASHCAELDHGFAQESLSSPSAKVWLTEYESHLCDRCTGEWGNPKNDNAEILNGRWENEDSPNGRRGRKAPCHSKLKVFGAFFNARYDEFIPARKRHRAMHIHRCGWS